MATALEQFSSQLVLEIKEVIPRVTGQTAESVERRFTANGFEITADAHLATLIYGRGPTKRGNSGGVPLRERILAWINAKGINPRPALNGKVPTKEQLAWMISSSIHKKGNLLYRRGGGNNFLETIVTESRIEAFAKTLLDEQTIKIESDFIKAFTI